MIAQNKIGEDRGRGGYLRPFITTMPLLYITTIIYSNVPPVGKYQFMDISTLVPKRNVSMN